MMKKILYIARNELYSLFYSPIAWFLMIVFLIMTSANYISLLDLYQGYFSKGGMYLMFVEELTSKLISEDPRIGYFYKVIRDLYIFLPLVTMGLLSREVGSGTIKLLYSSPVRIRQIVLGKYLAIICFMLCLLTLCAFTSIALSMSVTSPDYGIILSSLFALFLILGIYAAIGLFISSLTSYQIVAAIITLALFGLLSRIGDLWQDNDVLRNITFYLYLPMKTFNLLRGLLNLRDIFYCLILICAFLSFTMIRLKSATESISSAKKIARYALVIILAFMLAFITERPYINVYADATRNQRFTVTPPTQRVLSRLNDGPLEITLFCNLLSGFDYYKVWPQQQNMIKAIQLEPYIRFKPDIQVNFVYYYNTDSTSSLYKVDPDKTLKQIAEKQAESVRSSTDRFLSPSEVRKLVDVDIEENRNFFLLKYKDKQAVVRTFDDQPYWPDENQFAAALNRLVGIPPKVVFLTGEIQRNPFSPKVRDYKRIASDVGYRPSLLNKGFDFDTLSLINNDIPKDVAAVVLADPRMPLSEIGLKKINDYIDSGGNLLIATEPDRKEVIKPVLDKLGISLRPGLLIQPSTQFASDNIFPIMTDAAINFSPQFKQDMADERRYWGDSVFRLIMPGASVLEYEEKDGFIVEPLSYSDKNLSWNRITPISADSLQLKVQKQPGDEQQSFTTALRMHRLINNREQRIIVLADADIFTDPLKFPWSPESSRRYNPDFGSWCFSYFTYGQFPANTIRPKSKDNEFTITSKDVPKQKLILYWIIPAIIGIIGSILLVRRKRK